MKTEFSKTKYLGTVSKYGMLPEGSCVLVGFSGGADSSLLLTLLSETDGITVAAAHLNHGIRGEEALRDEYFCRRFCDENNITLYVKRADIPTEAVRLGIGLEEAARQARYSFFDEICREHGYDLIATAHNADDNLETVLFHLARGTGLDGLCGIPPVRGNIIRPLILYSKEEIIEGCKEYSIPFVSDSTNFDNAYTRNLIRNTVIPKLKLINPSLCDSISGSVELLSTDRDYLNSESSGYSFSDGRCALSVLPRPILSRVIISEMKKAGIQPERERISEIMMAIRSRSAHVALSVNGYSFVCDRDLLYFVSQKPNTEFCIPLAYGLNIIDGNSALLLYRDNDECSKDINKLKNIYKLSIQAELNSAKINDNAVIRSRRDGDIYRLNGMTRKVKKLIQSLKLPMLYTSRLPFIECDGEIIYIPHFPPCDSAKTIGENTAHIVFFSNYLHNQEQ